MKNLFLFVLFIFLCIGALRSVDSQNLAKSHSFELFVPRPVTGPELEMVISGMKLQYSLVSSEENNGLMSLESGGNGQGEYALEIKYENGEFNRSGLIKLKVWALSRSGRALLESIGQRLFIDLKRVARDSLGSPLPETWAMKERL